MTNETTGAARVDDAPAHSALGVSVTKRRLMNMFVKSSAVVATATALPALAKPAAEPVVAAATIEASPPIAPQLAEPTPIARLWAKHQAFREQYQAVHKTYEDLEREAEKRAGEPPAEIKYTEENAVLGLKPVGRSRDAYIWPMYIKSAISTIEYMAALATAKVGFPPTVAQLRALRGKPYRLTKKQEAERTLLRRRLRVSQRYHAKLHRIYEELGRDAVNKKMEALTGRQCHTASRILKMPAATPSDLDIKFLINERYGDDWAAESIMVDVQRLMTHPASLAKVLQEVHGGGAEKTSRAKPSNLDGDVISAMRDMVNLDNAIDRLHHEYGDDADSREDYRVLEAKREEVLELLYSKRARTPAGMVAKAAALRESRVIEDFEVQGKIAIALARDVMQYFAA